MRQLRLMGSRLLGPLKSFRGHYRYITSASQMVMKNGGVMPFRPDMQQPILKSIVKQRDISELIVMVKSYMMSGFLNYGEMLLESVRINRVKEWDKMTNTISEEMSGLLNMLVKYNLDQGNATKAYEQLTLFIKQRNSLTFALFLKYYLKTGEQDMCRQVLKDMKVGGYLMDATIWEHFYRTRVFTRSEIDMIIPLLHSLDNGSEMVSVQLDDIEEIIPEPEKPNVRSVAQLDDIKAIESNSHGIDFIKKALTALKTSISLEDKYAVQEKLERDCLDAATEQFKLAMAQFMNVSGSPNMSQIRKLMVDWYPLLTVHFVDICRGSTEFIGQDGSTIYYSVLLAPIQPEKIALIALQELCRVSAIDSRFDGVPMARIATNISSCLEREIFAQQVFKNEFLSYIKLHPKKRMQILHNPRAFTKFMEKTRAILDDSPEARNAGWITAWSTSMKAEVGTFVAIEAIKLLKFKPYLEATSLVPAFSHELVGYNNKRFGVIKMQPKLYEALVSEPDFIAVEPSAMPMIVPPNPWLSYNQGGYLTHKQICVRLKEDPVHLSVLHEANANGKMDKILRGLDILGQTAWVINEPILKVAIELWNSGINVSTHERPPTEKTFEYRPLDSFESKEKYREYLSERANYIMEKGKAHSTMCDTNYKLEIAKQFTGVPFYLPHSVDFRGRAYPIPPHLSHVGSDLSRGLLLFAEGRPLGERGLFWLKVQLANMFGFDK